MKAMLPALALLSPLLLGATAADPLAGRVAGTPVACIEASRVLGPEIIDTRRILYRQSQNRVWATTPQRTCPVLAPHRRLIVRPGRDRFLCANDRVYVFSMNSQLPSAVCRFGPFVPYDRPPA